MIPAEEQNSANEKARLAALAEYKILDTVIEEEFENIAYLATQLCNTPIALINFIKANLCLKIRE